MSVHRRRTRRRADLSQHFLRKGATAARLVQGTSISRADLVVEIGPGRGALTLPLARRAHRVVAVEIDAVLAAALRDGAGDRLEVVHADFLDTPLPAGAYKVFGNLPFARTTEMITKLVTAPNAPDDAWLIVQREAAHRFTGAPYVNETLWSLRLKPWWHVEIVDRLRRVDFDPPPSVEAVLLWLNRRARPLLSGPDARLYRRLIAHAYGSSPSMRTAARAWLTKTQLARLGRDLRFAPDAPPSALCFEQWLGIARFIAGSRRGREQE